MKKTNLTMLVDFYEITMANGYFLSGKGDDIATFDLFFRNLPSGSGYAIMAGVEQVVEYLSELEFADEDIEYLRGKGIFDDKFLNYLKNFKFECDVWAVPEGTPIFPREPILVVRGPVIQAQLVETMLLLTINHQSLIATKANRIVRAAQERPVFEFGTRRAQGVSAAVLGARSTYIGGCAGTACTIADQEFRVPAMGTMAHSWVQSFENEYEAFKAYAQSYPDNAVLLVDTYNVLKSGVPNAIKVFDEYKPINKGIRIDSGDVTYLTRCARKMLDNAGHEDCKIVVSNSMDEYIIRDVLLQGAQIDSFGVGEKLITSKPDPVFGGVYKLSTIMRNGTAVPTLKVSENLDKITDPGFKKVYRFFDNKNGKAIADVIALEEEVIDESKPYTIFDPRAKWKKKIVKNFTATELLKPIFIKGECVYEPKDIESIRTYCTEQLDTLWDEVTRFENPQDYFVDLSKKLWQLKQKLLEEYGERNVR